MRDFNPCNEANHSSQPTFVTLRRPPASTRDAACAKCRVAAGDLLDWDNIVRWITRYRPHLRGRPRLWSIHNYIDINRPRSWPASGTRKLLGLTRGELWITETSGVVVSRRYSKYDEQRAARATRRMFDLARRSPRITRLYSYQWQAPCDPYGWDSGWFRSNGLGPPAWRVSYRDGTRAEAESSRDRGARPAAVRRHARHLHRPTITNGRAVAPTMAFIPLPAHSR